MFTNAAQSTRLSSGPVHDSAVIRLTNHVFRVGVHRQFARVAFRARVTSATSRRHIPCVIDSDASRMKITAHPTS